MRRTIKTQIGRYEIKEPLGTGLMADVYHAFDTKLNGREVALKVLSDRFAQDRESVRRFRNEAFAAAQLRHPNIIDIYDFGKDDHRYYIAMRYISTGTLQQLLQKKPILLPKEAVQLLAPIADALDLAHQIPVVHRDIKPANILIDERDNAILTDFGIARIMRQINGMTPNDTARGTKIGTPLYMSPEQAAGKEVDKAADIYSLGVVLYKAVTGRVPFRGRNIDMIRDQHIHLPPPPPRSINPNISRALEEVILKALAKDPKERFDSAGEMQKSMWEAIGKASSSFQPIIEIEEPSPLDIWHWLYYFVARFFGWLNKPMITALTPLSTEVTSVTSAISKEKESAPPQPIDVFICCLPSTHKDQQLAHYLHDELKAQGVEVLMNDTRVSETKQIIAEVDQLLQGVDLLVVLLSPQSVRDQMMEKIVRHAYDYRKVQEQPRILPIRVGYPDCFPSAINNCLDPQQYVVWKSPKDNTDVAQQIMEAIRGYLPPKTPFQPEYYEETRPIQKKAVTGQEAMEPEPEVDPRTFLEALKAPGGAVSGKYYIKRTHDEQIKGQVTAMGSLTTIRAARQTGKTSLLVQGIYHARQKDVKVVNIDLQRVDRTYLQNRERFLRYLADYIVWQLELDLDQVAQIWRGPLGPQDKLTRVLERYVLPRSSQPLMLAMDEVDRLLVTDFHSDFFGLVRSWHNGAADTQEQWHKLNIVLVISTEPYLLIADETQSPFNVGLTLFLEDFNTIQVHQLNRRHGFPLKEIEIGQLMNLLNGHPYLTRKALYTLVKVPSLSWPELKGMAASNQGPFIAHLRRYHSLLRHNQVLKDGLWEVIHHQRCPDEKTLHKLLRAGLVKGNSEDCTCRCDLYHKYFEDKLR